MNAAALATARAGPPPPRWLAAALLVLLVVPFDPFWIDFEQVRRGVLLLLAGAVLVGVRGLRPIAGERWWLALVGALVASALVAQAGDAWFRAPDAMATFQPWDAAYRIAHWLALLVVLRLGAEPGGRAAAAPVLVVLLAATSAFGLLQRLGISGLDRLTGYGVEREPVSAFGNLNVAAEWTAAAATTVAVLLPALGGRWARAALAAIALAGAYTVVNGSRSALLALPVGVALLALLRRRERGWLPLAALVAGALLGTLVGLVGPRVAATPEGPLRHAAQRGGSTVEVRLEIAKGAAKLFAPSPGFGIGPGQFAVQYPRVRSEREIELSSHERQFPVEVRIVHDDWLEILVDGGLVALAMFAAALFALQRAQRDKPALLPLFVLLLLMLVRSPLWNAPAVVAALLLVAVPDDGARAGRARRLTEVALGLALLALAVPVLVASHFGARYQQQRVDGEQPGAEHLRVAAAWMPWEPRFLQLLSQERLFTNDLAGAASAAAKALQLRPLDPQLHVHLGEPLARLAKLPEALAIARQGLTIDPPNPALRVLASTVLAQQGDADGAVLAVAVEPHPVLRAQLANHFRDLADLCARRDDQRSAARFRVEQHFVTAVDCSSDTSDDGARAYTAHVIAMGQAMKAVVGDGRLAVFGALAALDAGQVAKANEWGREATKRYPALAPWQRALLVDQLERLRALDGWQEFLAKR